MAHDSLAAMLAVQRVVQDAICSLVSGLSEIVLGRLGTMKFWQLGALLVAIFVTPQLRDKDLTFLQNWILLFVLVERIVSLVDWFVQMNRDYKKDLAAARARQQSRGDLDGSR